ncbi:hypothetical protein LguiA_007991 [Lonicera macranthoides]
MDWGVCNDGLFCDEYRLALQCYFGQKLVRRDEDGCLPLPLEVEISYTERCLCGDRQIRRR